MKITALMVFYRGYIIVVVHHSTSIEGVDPADYFYRVEIHTLLNNYFFESINTFHDENDALEYGKLIVDKWHAESVYSRSKDPLSSLYGIMNKLNEEARNGTNTQQ